MKKLGIVKKYLCISDHHQFFAGTILQQISSFRKVCVFSTVNVSNPYLKWGLLTQINQTIYNAKLCNSLEELLEKIRKADGDKAVQEVRWWSQYNV